MGQWRTDVSRRLLKWESLRRRGLTLHQIEEVRLADIEYGRRAAGLNLYPGVRGQPECLNPTTTC